MMMDAACALCAGTACSIVHSHLYDEIYNGAEASGNYEIPINFLSLRCPLCHREVSEREGFDGAEQAAGSDRGTVVRIQESSNVACSTYEPFVRRHPTERHDAA